MLVLGVVLEFPSADLDRSVSHLVTPPSDPHASANAPRQHSAYQKTPLMRRYICENTLRRVGIDDNGVCEVRLGLTA